MIKTTFNLYYPSQVSFQRKLVPVSEYKGPILKLTKKEKAEVDRLYAERARYEVELSKIHQIMGDRRLSCEIMDTFNRSIDRVITMIEDIDKAIKDIKTSRLKKQIEAMKKN